MVPVHRYLPLANRSGGSRKITRCQYISDIRPFECDRPGCVNAPEATLTYATPEGGSLVKRVCTPHAIESADRAPLLTRLRPGLVVTVGGLGR